MLIRYGDCAGTSLHNKKTRGPTKGAGTYDVVNKSQGQIQIRLDPEHKLVEGIKTHPLFVNEIGIITRAKAPLNVLGLKKVPKEDKQEWAETLKVSEQLNVV